MIESIFKLLDIKFVVFFKDGNDVKPHLPVQFICIYKVICGR